MVACVFAAVWLCCRAEQVAVPFLPGAGDTLRQKVSYELLELLQLPQPVQYKPLYCLGIVPAPPSAPDSFKACVVSLRYSSHTSAIVAGTVFVSSLMRLYDNLSGHAQQSGASGLHVNAYIVFLARSS